MARRHPALRLVWMALIAGVALTAACSDDILEPPTSEVDSLFNKYVAIGNSITAGFQSGGLNDSTQNESYAVLLAAEMGTDFNVPEMNSPGCPPPFVNIFTQQRMLGLSDSDCFLRVAPIPEFLHNVAVPGAAVVDVLTNLGTESDPNPLTTFFLGGQTQLEAAAVILPTFVSVWIGNNDVLGAILDPTNPGDPALVTDPAVFAQRYGAMMDSLDAFGSIQGGVLIGVGQVVFLPYLTQGRAWAAFELQFDAATAPLNAFDVLANCLTSAPIPGTSDLVWVSVPFPVGGSMLAEANAKIDSVLGGTLAPGSLVPVTMDCSITQMVSTDELLNMVGAVVAYNQTIATEAADRGWAYLDPNTLLEALLPDPTAIRPFPAFDPADPQHETAPFGTALSRDGIHPSTATHLGTAQALVLLINATYSTAIPLP